MKLDKEWEEKEEEKEEEWVRAGPAVLLAQDVLDGLGQGEGLAGAVGPNEEDGRQWHGDGRGDGQDGLLLLGVEPWVQLLVPLPAGGERGPLVCVW